MTATTFSGATATFPWHGATITLSANGADALRAELERFGIGTTHSGTTTEDTPTAKKSSAATPARSEPTASGVVAGAQEKTADASAQSAGNAAAEPQASTAAIDFETLKKAFLALSNTADGRTKCEAVLKAVEPALPKLSAAKPEQYADLLAAINKQGE